MSGEEQAAVLKAPYPYFGGKSRAAALIWAVLGECGNYVEPFFGSGAVLLGRPTAPHLETVNDRDCHIANFWRAMRHDPAGLAKGCDEPVNEIDMHAWHLWLVEPMRRKAFEERLICDPAYYDLTRAARWCWGLASWIGSGWCSGQGAWGLADGQLVHLGTAGRGVQRQLVHLGDAGRGVQRQLVHLGNAGQGADGLYAWFDALATRLRRVRVCCGDWTRVLGPSVTYKHGLTGIVLDPPYSQEENRTKALYAVDDLTVAHDVREWCLTHGTQPLLRIVLCGYGEIHDALLAHGWTKTCWTANGGMGNQNRDQDNQNKWQERVWLSPHCLKAPQLDLFP